MTDHSKHRRGASEFARGGHRMDENTPEGDEQLISGHDWDAPPASGEAVHPGEDPGAGAVGERGAALENAQRVKDATRARRNGQ
jgi:hypothetical protein